MRTDTSHQAARLTQQGSVRRAPALVLLTLLLVAGSGLAATWWPPARATASEPLTLRMPGTVWEDRSVVLQGQAIPAATPTPSVTPPPTPTPTGTPTATATATPTPTVTPSDLPTALQAVTEKSVTEQSGTRQSAPSTVELWTRPAAGGAWRRLGAAAVGPTGTFALQALWPTPGQVLVEARQGTHRSSLVVPVHDRRVVLAPRPARARALLDPQRVSGTVVPAEAGQRVRVTWRGKDARGRWRSAWRTRTVTTDRNGRWATMLPTLHRSGRVVVRAASGAGTSLEATASAATRIREEFAVRAAPVTAAELKHSYRPGCPVGPSQLVRLRMTYRDYSGAIRWGNLVVARTARPHITSAFRKGFRTGFRIKKMFPVERYRGHDPAAMADNNTSAFNCRRVTGDPFSLSPHAYGTAVDINTVQNPYRDSHGRWWPHRNAWVDRNRRAHGMIHASSPVRVEFGAQGFQWGGFWSNPDWQHFDPRGALRPPRSARRVRTGPVQDLDPSLLPSTLPGGFRPAPGQVEHGRAPTPQDHTRRPEEVLDAVNALCGPLTVAAPMTARQRSYRSPSGRSAQALAWGTGTRAQSTGLAAALEGCSPAGLTWQVRRPRPRVVLVIAAER